MASEKPQEATVPLSDTEETSQEQQAVESNGATTTVVNQDGEEAAKPIPMSKNALKRLRKQEQWEEEKDERRKKRKEKRQDRRVRKREERAALVAQGIDPRALQPRRPTPTNVPVAIVLDCDFESYMMDKEIISLGAQVTRSYSENRQARYRSRLWVSGWSGRLCERFNTVMEGHHLHWGGIEFVDGDFVKCAELAREKMRSGGDKSAGVVTEALQRSVDNKTPWVRDETDPFPMPDPEPELRDEYKDIVYLSSDSPYTLERLEPYTTYVVGGIVDKNREKGLCYKRARERGIRTARLPIGQYMVMQSRAVLATNHVVEIMLKWLEYEDWGQAFLSVIPKRKGGRLRGDDNDDDIANRDETAEAKQAGDDDAVVVQEEHTDEQEKETMRKLAEDSQEQKHEEEDANNDIALASSTKG